MNSSRFNEHVKIKINNEKKIVILSKFEIFFNIDKKFRFESKRYSFKYFNFLFFLNIKISIFRITFVTIFEKINVLINWKLILIDMSIIFKIFLRLLNELKINQQNTLIFDVKSNAIFSFSLKKISNCWTTFISMLIIFQTFVVNTSKKMFDWFWRLKFVSNRLIK